jgi:hypothetical protein
VILTFPEDMLLNVADEMELPVKIDETGLSIMPQFARAAIRSRSLTSLLYAAYYPKVSMHADLVEQVLLVRLPSKGYDILASGFEHRKRMHTSK